MSCLRISVTRLSLLLPARCLALIHVVHRTPATAGCLHLQPYAQCRGVSENCLGAPSGEGRQTVATGSLEPPVPGLCAAMVLLLEPVVERPFTTHRPHPQNLGDVVGWGIGQLAHTGRSALACLPTVMILGTACSGSNCAVVVL